MSRFRVPRPLFDHLLRMIDDTGILEHARFGVSRREHGYTADDASRALIVLCRAPRGDEIDGAIWTLLSFLIHCVGDEGLTHNRLGFDRRWRDEPHMGDHHGRTAWALAVAASSAPRPEWRDAARAAFDDLAPSHGEHLRPYAFGALGAAEILESSPGDDNALKIIDRAIDALTVGGGPWPEPRLRYSNGRLPQALLRMGQVLGEPDLSERGIGLLDWLVEVERSDRHFSFTPSSGWSPGQPRPGFDQQPIEAAAMADAALCAWFTTGEEHWESAVVDTGLWLLGENDIGEPLLEPETGACYDGLTLHGVNANQGAESTIAALSVLQACEQVTAVERTTRPEEGALRTR